MEHIQITENIKRFRNIKGMTQKEISEALFMDERTYSNFERGLKKSIDVKLLMAISKVLGIDISSLVADAGAAEEKRISIEEKLEQILDEINDLKASFVSELNEIRKELQMEKTA